VSDVTLRPAGDAAWFIELEDRLDEAINERAIAIGRAVVAAGLPGVRDVVTGYRSVAVHVDPLRIDAATMDDALARLASDTTAGAREAADVVRVPVCYGGALGPDLAEVAAFARCSEDAVVELHCSRTYRVYMVGFVPGFPYMGTVHPRIAMPRRESPRLRVPALSVGIAGEQTGIYPTSTPGGWRLIGLAAVRPFDVARTPPCLFEPGTRVLFVPIGAAELARLEGGR
jgi:inhibitor of KinA